MAEVFDVFISYRRRDGEDIAKALYDFLAGKGVRVFRDKEKLEIGKSFPDQLHNAIKKAPHYVLVGTKGAFDFRAENVETGDLDFVKEEIRTALANRDTDRTVTVYVPKGAELPSRGDLPADMRDILNQDNLIATDLLQTEAFDKILGVVTAVSRANLWHAAHRWLENGKRPGGRFARLRIEKNIMPSASEKKDREELPIEVITDKESGDTVPLLDAIKNTGGNLYLIGEGGIGKTTSLIHIMEETYGNDYSQTDQVPIFVELSFAPDKNGKWIEPRKSTFIFRSIYKQIIDRRDSDQDVNNGVEELDEVFGMDPSVAVKPVKDLFTRESPSPEYLLLLDGLNEVSPAKIKGGDETVIGLVLQEIRYITENCPNVRVILTSRSDESAVPFDGFTRIYLSGVDEKNIEKYLTKSGMPLERIKAAKEDKELMKTLRVPLFLTMYADLKDTVGINTQGEILNAFFSERRVNISAYTAQKRLAQIGTNFVYSEPSVEKARLSADMQIFILDLILPRIGYEMEKNGLHYISPLKLYGPMLDVINGKKITDECGIYGKYVFPVVCKDGTEKSPKAVAKSMLDAFDNDEDEICEAILDCLVKNLGLFQITNGEYGFIHQHFRDYFSAVKDINVMKLSAALSKDGEKDTALGLMNAYFKDKPVSLQIRRFIGEITGEHHNKPYRENKTWKPPQKESLVMKALDIYRGIDRKTAGYGVYSLIHILNEARTDLSGCDFSRLDFTGCGLNGMRLSRKGLAAKFSDAVVHGENIIYKGHTFSIDYVSCSPDGMYLLSKSKDGAVKIWDTNTLQLIYTLKEKEIKYAGFSPPDSTGAWLNRYIITVSADGRINQWDADDPKSPVTIKQVNRTAQSAVYRPDGKHIMILDSGVLTIIDAASYEVYGTIARGKIKTASYSPDSKHIVTTSLYGNTAKVWSAESLKPCGTLKRHKGDVNAAVYSPGGQHIVTVSSDKTAKLWDAHSFELLCTSEINESKLISAVFSHDGKRIITMSSDKTAKVWTADSLSLLKTFKHINVAGFSTDDKYIILAYSSSLTLCDAETYVLTEEAKGSYNSVKSAVFNSAGNRIVTTSYDNTAKVWDADSFVLLGTLEGHTARVFSAVYSPDDKHIVTASRDHTAKVWDADSFELSGTLDEHSSSVVSAAYNKRGEHIVTASYDKTAKIWDAENFNPLGTLKGHTRWINTAAYNPEGDLIVTASYDKTAKVWREKGCEPVKTLDDHNDLVYSASFSPDGKRIITVSRDNTVKFWSAENYAFLDKIDEYAYNVEFSPDGKYVIILSRGCAKIYDAENLDPCPPIEDNSYRVNSVHYNRNGTLIITANENGVIKIWDANSFVPLKEAPCFPGLDLMGVDFTQLHPRSQIGEDEKDVIRRYGGII